MVTPIILASQSQIRQDLLSRAGISFTAQPARIDEQMITAALRAEGVAARDIADALAEAKAKKVSSKNPAALVIGCDQVLSFGDHILSKPDTPETALSQLKAMRGKTHSLFSAAVIFVGAEPVWRHVGRVNMVMRTVSDAYLHAYVTRNWDSIRHAVGCYKLEEEGVRLFSRVDGDFFHVLGLPLSELITFLSMRGDIDT